MDRMQTKTAAKAMAEAMKRAGGANALARALTAAGHPITGQAVGRWVIVPINRVMPVHLLTDLPLWELRPDFYIPPWQESAPCGPKVAAFPKSSL